jgi:phosphotransferase system IIA component
MNDLHHVTIKSSDGSPYLTHVEIDGQEIKGALSVSFDSSMSRKYAVVELRLIASVDIDTPAYIEQHIEWTPDVVRYPVKEVEDEEEK